jgi:two-component system NtrC family sensor kinase
VKLARRFLAYMLAGVLVVLLLETAITVQRERALFQSDTIRDHEVLARAVAPAFAQTWQLEGEERAKQLLARVTTAEGSFRASYSDDGAAHRLTRIVHDEVRDPGGVKYLVTRAPVALGARHGFIELRESMQPRRDYIRATLGFTMLTGLGIFAWCGVLAVVLGVALVGRPIQLLSEQARRIGLGEFEAPSKLPRNDELGELGLELSSMGARLAETHAALARETDARLNMLNQLRRADRLATVGKLAAGVAHELGTPLNVVSGRASLIQENETAPDGARNNARIIMDQARRMTRIIRQLLDFSRGSPPKKEPMNVRTSAERVITLLEAAAKKRCVRLILSCEHELPLLFADSDQIEQALTNIVANAIQAMPKAGAINISIDEASTAPPQGGEKRPYVVVHVRDQGTGMSPQVAARVFEPFFTTKDVGEGTGLGLSVTYGIIEEHGGFISLESSEGNGTHFSVYLPLGQLRTTHGAEFPSRAASGTDLSGNLAVEPGGMSRAST